MDIKSISWTKEEEKEEEKNEDETEENHMNEASLKRTDHSLNLIAWRFGELAVAVWPISCRNRRGWLLFIFFLYI